MSLGTPAVGLGGPLVVGGQVRVGRDSGFLRTMFSLSAVLGKRFLV